MVTYLVNYFSTIESSTGAHTSSYLVFCQYLLDRMTISFTGSGLLIPIWWHVIVVQGQSSSLWSHSMTREIKMLLQMACMSRKNREVKLKSTCFFLFGKWIMLCSQLHSFGNPNQNDDKSCCLCFVCLTRLSDPFYCSLFDNLVFCFSSAVVLSLACSSQLELWGNDFSLIDFCHLTKTELFPSQVWW